MALPTHNCSYNGPKTANYTVVTYDDVIVGSTTAGGLTFTLPAASACYPGQRFVFLNVGSANTLTVAAAGSDTINGAATDTAMSSQYSKITVVCDGLTKWFKIA